MRPEDFVALAKPFPEAHLLVARHGSVLAANPAAVRALGLPSPRPDGVSLHDLSSGDGAALDAYLAACARSGAAVPGRLSLRVDGAPRPYRCEGAVVRPWSEDAPALLVIRLRPHEDAAAHFVLLNRKIEALTREIFERRRAEEALGEQAMQLEELTAELEQTIEELQQQREEAEAARVAAEEASRAKSDFLAVMSHELRTPLNAILGYADLLDAEIGGTLSDVQHEQVARVARSAGHLLTLIEGILTFSRLESGHETVRAEPVDLRSLAREAAELMEPVAGGRGLSLKVSLPRDPVPLRTDGARVRQILINLLGNAVKFTESGAVRMTVSARPDSVSVAVTDTGPGIAMEDRERIFEPFVQLDSARTRRAGGTGLGLPVSRELARLLGGDVVVRSAPGDGSTFTLVLPRHPPD